MAAQLIAEFETECDHGIIVVEGRSSKATHSTWNPSTERHHLDDDSLYVVAMPSVEGTVEVKVYDGLDLPEASGELQVLFEGFIRTDSDALVIGDSDANEERVLTLGSGSLSIIVLGNSPQFSERVMIGVREMF